MSAILFLLSLCVIVLPQTVLAGPLTYSAAEIRGQVVDADSGTPIEGAVVVAQWLLSPSLVESHESYHRRFNIAEAVTDRSGHYAIPRWGPKLRVPFSILDNTNPRLSLVKSGYAFEWLTNQREHTTSQLMSDWDGKVIRLKRFDGTIEQWASGASDFFSELHHGVVDYYSDWLNYPRATAALCDEMRRLKAQGLKPGDRPDLPGDKRLREQEGKVDKTILERCKDGP